MNAEVEFGANFGSCVGEACACVGPPEECGGEEDGEAAASF